VLVSLQSQEEEEEEEKEKEEGERWRHAPNPGGRARGVHQICWHSVLPKLQVLQGGKNALVTEVTDSMEEEVLLLP
jgi:hypothetical protein